MDDGDDGKLGDETRSPVAAAFDPEAMQAQLVQMQQMMQQMMSVQMNQMTSAQNVTPRSGGEGKSTAKRPDRPVVERESTETEWARFLDSWERYKEVTELASDVRILYELRSACSREVDKELFELYGTELKNCSETELLAKIRSVAVSTLHKEVHRQVFKDIVQIEGESYTQYMARLRSKAQLCEFSASTKCVCGNDVSVNYADDAIAAQLIAGVTNTTHQSKVLAEASTRKSLKDKFDLLLSLEATDKSTSQLAVEGKSALSALQTKHAWTNRDGRKIDKCVSCGRLKHTAGKECPALKMTCYNCGGIGHMAKACKKPRKSNKKSRSSQACQESVDTDSEEESVSFGSFLFSQNDVDIEANHKEGLGMPHMEWNGKEFVPEKPASPPKIAVSIVVMDDVHKKFGKRHAGPLGSPKQVTCPDTGAQTCNMGLDVLKKLNIPISYLVKTKHRIGGVTQTSLEVMGSVFVKIRRGDEVTRQVIYVAKNILGLFLSQSALKDLKMIPSNFPFDTVTAASNEVQKEFAPCGCLKRSPPPVFPKEIPFAAVQQNREKLEQWILEYYKSSAFNVCPHQPPPSMTGKDMEINFKENVEPYAVHTPIPVPHHWKQEVKTGLDQDSDLQVIEPVPQGTPTTWCARMIVVPKNDGSPRRTVDLQKLNDATLRETHHTPTPFEQVSTVPPNTLKTILDAWNGYHSVLLAQESRDATTFITEWGRYRYLRAPMGFHASGDVYTKRFDDITVDMERKTRCIDDSLLWDNDLGSAFWHTLKYIVTCNRNGVVFNPKKFVFGKSEVDFAGFTLTENSVRPSDKLVSAIRDFPTPSNLTAVRSWFGLVNQVSFTFGQAQVMAPFRELLKKYSKFYWDETLQGLFEKSKAVIIEKINEGVRMFELSRPTCIETDWCEVGIGFSLLQQHCSCPMMDGPHCGDGHWKVIFCGSRFLSEAEQNYVPIEGESLALAHGLESCRMFILGCPNLLVSVDHKPLVKIMGDKPLEKIDNLRVQRLKERIMRFRFQIKYTPGKLHVAPDATSRNPVTLPIDDDFERGIESRVAANFCTDQLKSITWERVKEAVATDHKYQALIELVRDGFPEKKQEVIGSLRIFWPMREELCIVGGIVAKGQKILVPQSLRSEVLEGLHSAHQGVTGMAANANQRLFWPGFNADLNMTRAQCGRCNERAPSQAAEPLLPPEEPDFPFQQTVTDFAEVGAKHYLIYADRYTGWVEVACMPDGKSKTVCDNLRGWFTTYGVPSELASDGGPPFASLDVKMFLQDWGVRHRMSSVGFAQSNGRAELAVKTAKRILAENVDARGRLNTDKAAHALLCHRNTPAQDVNISPATMLFGRNIKDHLPTLLRSEKIRTEWKEIRKAREHALAKRYVRSAERYNEHAHELPALKVGDHVRVQRQSGNHPKFWDITGTVVEVMGNRQYRIKIDGSGRVTLRNRRFIRKIVPATMPFKLSDKEEKVRHVRDERSAPSCQAPTDHQVATDCLEENVNLDTQVPSNTRRPRVTTDFCSDLNRAEEYANPDVGRHTPDQPAKSVDVIKPEEPSAPTTMIDTLQPDHSDVSHVVPRRSDRKRQIPRAYVPSTRGKRYEYT